MEATPLETCLLYGMVDSELIPMEYAHSNLALVWPTFGLCFFAGAFWPILTHMS